MHPPCTDEDPASPSLLLLCTRGHDSFSTHNLQTRPGGNHHQHNLPKTAGTETAEEQNIHDYCCGSRDGARAVGGSMASAPSCLLSRAFISEGSEPFLALPSPDCGGSPLTWTMDPGVVRSPTWPPGVQTNALYSRSAAYFPLVLKLHRPGWGTNPLLTCGFSARKRAAWPGAPAASNWLRLMRLTVAHAH